MKHVAVLGVLVFACHTTAPVRQKKSVDAILSDYNLELIYKTDSQRIRAKGYYFVDTQESGCREDIAAAGEELLAQKYIVTFYYDMSEAAFPKDHFQIWRVPEQRVPSWEYNPDATIRRYNEREQAYFIPLRDVNQREAEDKLQIPAYAVLIPAALKDDVLIMYAEQEAHPAVAFYECKKNSNNDTTSVPSPN